SCSTSAWSWSTGPRCCMCGTCARRSARSACALPLPHVEADKGGADILAAVTMDTFPDLGSLTDQELKDLIRQLTEEEMEISYKRRILHGKIDILRAELVNRLRKKD